MGIKLQAGEFGIFPARLAKGRPYIQQAVLAWLWFHKNNETNSCFPSLATLQKECGISSKHSVLNALTALEDAGLIVKDRRFDDKGSNCLFRYSCGTIAKQVLPAECMVSL